MCFVISNERANKQINPKVQMDRFYWKKKFTRSLRIYRGFIELKNSMGCKNLSVKIEN